MMVPEHKMLELAAAENSIPADVVPPKYAADIVIALAVRRSAVPLQLLWPEPLLFSRNPCVIGYNYLAK
jgi:hypothetical protein